MAVFFEFLRVEFSQNFEFSLKLSLFDFMQTLFIILIAEVVDGDLPSLKKMSRSVRDLLTHAGQVASVIL